MQKINLHYLAQLLDQSGITHTLPHIESTIDISVGDDDDHEYEIRMAIDGDTVWVTSSSITFTGASPAALSQIMQKFMQANMTLSTPARIGMHPNGQAMVLMALPIYTPFGISAESLKTFVLEFVVVVQEVIDMLESMSAPSPNPWINEHQSKARCNPNFNVKHFCKLLEMRKRRLSRV